MTDFDQAAFTAWLTEVDEWIDELTNGSGCTQSDFADWNSRDAFDSECDPKDAAIQCLENDDIGEMYLQLT
jgi:hypothetical protein